MVLRCGGIAVAACAEVVVRAVDASETWPHNVLLASGASAKWMPNSGSSYFHILHIQPRQGPRVWSCLVCPCFIPLEAMPTTLLAVTAMGIFTTDHAVATVLGHGVEGVKKCGSCFVRYYKCIVNLPLGQKTGGFKLASIFWTTRRHRGHSRQFVCFHSSSCFNSAWRAAASSSACF